MITGIDHVQVSIPKGAEAIARAFYCGVLGLREVPKPAALVGRRGFWLQVGAMQLHVGADAADAAEAVAGRRASKAHVALMTSDLGLARAALAAAGVAVTEGLPIPGCERCDCRDPFGNRLELMQQIVP
jgi:catechol 2,3-dioxygenase-like lactoylglutathione lyase family enzyme